MNQCLNCDYWHSINPELGECRQKAPIIRNIEDGRGTPFWPYVSKCDGCGDFVLKISFKINDGNEDES